MKTAGATKMKDASMAAGTPEETRSPPDVKPEVRSLDEEEEEEDEKENVPEVRVTRSRAKKLGTLSEPDKISSPGKKDRKQESKNAEGIAENVKSCKKELLSPKAPTSTPDMVITSNTSPLQDITNKSNEHAANCPTQSELLPPTLSPHHVDEPSAPDMYDADPGRVEQKQSTSSASPALNDEGNRSQEKSRLGTVVVWGKLFEDLCFSGKTDSREDIEQQGQQPTGDTRDTNANPNPDANADGEQVQVPNDQIDVENHDENSELRRSKRSYSRRTRAKRDPELMTKTEHMRILRSALRNTMQCKVRDVLGLQVGEITDPTDEISQAIQGAITRKRRGRKCKANLAKQSAGSELTESNENATNVNIDETNQDDNGENAQELDDDGIKPRTTYHELIKIALEENPDGMTVSEIYNWLSNRHPSFQMDDTRWKNSVRHNLSINPYFEKHTQLKGKGGSGGHVWKISEKYANCSQSRPPSMKRAKFLGRPRRPADDSEYLRREFTQVMLDAGLGNVKHESLTMSMDEDPLMLGQDVHLYSIEGYEDQAGEPFLDSEGNYTFADVPFHSEAEYANYMFSELPPDGTAGEYFLVDQSMGNLDIGNLSQLNLPDNSFGPYMPMDETPIATIDMSQLSAGVHNINLVEYQHARGEPNDLQSPTNVSEQNVDTQEPSDCLD